MTWRYPKVENQKMNDCDLNGKLLGQDEYVALMHLFKMFADTTRLKIFTVLAVQECGVNDLSEKLGMTQSAISHQLSTLRHANLVKFRKVGQNVYYSLSDDHVMTIFKQALNHIRE